MRSGKFAVVIALLLATLSAGAAEPSWSVVIKKSERTLHVYKDGKLHKSYKIALGFTPAGAKERAGDGRTPEGDYHIVQKNPKSNFYLSLGLDYPSVADAQRGLAARLITKAQHDQIVAAHKRGRMPPQFTKLGGLLYVHGGGIGRDWTWGCIALENDDIRELYDLLPLGTPVHIDP